MCRILHIRFFSALKCTVPVFYVHIPLKITNTVLGVCNVYSILIRAVVVYATVIFSIRVMGKRQVGDLQPGELVITFLISELAALPLEDRNQPLLVGVMSVFVLAVLEIVVSFVAMKSIRARKFINGRSVVLIWGGTIDQKALKRLRITVPDLMELLRCQNIFDVAQVDYAILETNGQLSVLLKRANQPATSKDMGVKVKKEGYPALVVSDGVLLTDSVALVGATPKEIERILAQKGLKLQQVFLMTMDQYGKHTVVKKGA